MIYTLTLNPAVDRELQVPTLAFDTVLRAGRVQVDAGGKGFNVSRGLKLLGVNSIALGFVGGFAGEQIKTILSGLSIDTEFISIAEETRTNVSVVSDRADHHLKVNEPGPTISSTEYEALLAKIRGLIRADDWWVIAGSLPRGLPTTVYRDIVELVQQGGSRALLDTSGTALMSGCEAMPALIKPNHVEASTLVDFEVDSTDTAVQASHQLRAKGIPVVLISLGSQGAILNANDQVWLATPPSIREQNPIGAGDASVAGILYGLTDGYAWPDALRWSMGSGAAAASLPGTQMGVRELVAKFADQVTIREL